MCFQVDNSSDGLQNH